MTQPTKHFEDDPISGLLPRDLLGVGLRDDGDLCQEQIGCYRLVEPIGEGGMGVVYMAEQLEPVERLVALKVIKRGMDTDEMIARFSLERQTLASLEHPHIARVFDAGATPGGRPYFVMELVEGVPLILFSDREGLGIGARLELFLQACDAVSHAHRRGVIHRDLKPSNLLVSGVPPGELKVIDFGIAKVARLPTDLGRTQVGQVVGTPEYMCPEQASGAEIDTRADIFSLGKVLSELVGKPFPRDLGWIILRATEEERQRRYGSVDEFADDLRRFRLNRPVLARRPSSVYRVRKYLQRNRTGVIAALMIAGACAFGFWKTLESRALRRDADMAQRESEKASTVTAFVSELLEAMREPDESKRREAMAVAVRYFDDHLAKIDNSRPEVAFLTQQMLGSAYCSLGLDDRAEHSLREARRLADEYPFPDDDLPMLVAVETNLGEILIGRGDLAEAEMRMSELLRNPKVVPSPELGNYLVRLGQALCETSKHTQAQTLFTEVRHLEEQMSGIGSERWLHVTAWLAHTHARLDQAGESISILEEAIEIAKRKRGVIDSPEISGIVEDLRRLQEENP